MTVTTSLPSGDITGEALIGNDTGGGRLTREAIALAAGRAVRIIVGGSTHAELVGAMAHAVGRQPRAHVSRAAAERNYDPGRLDAATGCEFVDDRLRQRE